MNEKLPPGLTTPAVSDVAADTVTAGINEKGSLLTGLATPADDDTAGANVKPLPVLTVPPTDSGDVADNVADGVNEKGPVLPADSADNDAPGANEKPLPPTDSDEVGAREEVPPVLAMPAGTDADTPGINAKPLPALKKPADAEVAGALWPAFMLAGSDVSGVKEKPALPVLTQLMGGDVSGTGTADVDVTGVKLKPLPALGMLADVDVDNVKPLLAETDVAGETVKLLPLMLLVTPAESDGNTAVHNQSHKHN